VRLFVAIDVPQHVKDAIETGVARRLRGAASGARWTRPEGRHLTLKFLGNVDDDREAEIAGVVEAVAARHAAFEAAFNEIGGFPNVRRPRVLWVGIGQGNEAMAEIAADLESSFAPLGFEPEGRDFREHFTLARFPKPTVLELPAIAVPDEVFAVRELILFESKLHPKGARYTVRDRFEFS
jgi:2'-5' RNA ligase